MMSIFFFIYVLISLKLIFLSASPNSDCDFHLIDVFGDFEDDIDEISYPWSEMIAYEYEYFKSNFDEGYYSFASSSDAKEAIQDDKFRVSGKLTLNSIRMVFPEAFREVNLRAAVMLFYGIEKDHLVYSVAKNYIDACYKSGHNNYDPNSLYSFSMHNIIFEGLGLDIGSLSFKEFCEYVFYHEMPKTSPLLSDKMFIPFRKKWQYQREALLNFASAEIIDIFNRININDFKKELNLGETSGDIELVELVINMLISESPRFLSLTVKQDGNFNQKLESFIWHTIVDACEQCKIDDQTIRINIEQELLAKLLPTLDLIYNYNDPKKIDQAADLNYSYFII